MAAITQTIKKPSFRYPTKDPDTYLNFVNANSDYVDCGTHFTFSDKTRQFTLSAWIKPNVSLPTSFRIASNERTSNLAGDGSFTISSSTNQASFTIDRSTNPNPYSVTWTSTATVPLGRWSHVVFIVDHINSLLTFVINGVAETVDMTWTTGDNYVDTFTNIEIGRHRNYTFGTTYADGSIANVKIYDGYLLPIEEAQAQYIRGINDYGYSDETGLTAAYHLNEGTGTVAVDAKESSQNHGTLLGSGAQEDRWINNQSRTYREAVLRDGPKAYWRMKELSGFEVEDETGNFGKLMQHFNAPTVGQDGPFPGSLSVLYTRASSQYSQINENILGVATFANAYSGEAWIKSTELSIASQGCILTQRDSSNNTNISGTVSTSNSMDMGEYPPAGNVLSSPSNTIRQNAWHHVVWTKDIAENARNIYVDGVLVASDASPDSSVVTAMVRLIVGASVGTEYFQGYISEAALYDYKLSAAQVYDHYLAATNARLPLLEAFESYTGGGAAFFPNGKWVHARDYANWTVSTITGNFLRAENHTTGADIIINTEVGQFYKDGIVSSEVVIGATGHANTQPGIVGRWVDINNCCWISLNNGFNKLTIVSYVGGVPNLTEIAMTWTRGQTYYVDFIMNGTSLVCNVFSDAAKTVLVKTGSQTTSHNVAGYMGLVSNAQPTGQGYYDNWLFTKYNAKELEANYTATVLAAAPVAYYKHSSNLGKDSSGNANNAHTITAVTNATGKVGGSGLYNGSTSEMWISPAASINDLAASGNAYSVECWVYYTTTGTHKMIASKANLGESDGGFNCWIDTSQRLSIRRFDTGLSTIEIATTAVPTGQWVHLVAVMSASNTGTFYYNGVSQTRARTQTGNNNTISDADGDLLIGSRNEVASYNFNGYLDEVAIYNRELTAEEAMEHYIAGISM